MNVLKYLGPLFEQLVKQCSVRWVFPQWLGCGENFSKINLSFQIQNNLNFHNRDLGTHNFTILGWGLASNLEDIGLKTTKKLETREHIMHGIQTGQTMRDTDYDGESKRCLISKCLQSKVNGVGRNRYSLTTEDDS